MKFIPLTKGYVAIVDDEDYEILSQYSWQALVSDGHRSVYAHRCEKRKWIAMHRQISGVSDSTWLDHKNHCGIDNRKENLRVCTPMQNARNRESQRWAVKTSKHKGVGFEAGQQRAKKWRARIKVNRKSKHIGWFATEQEAVRAYNDAAQQHFGEFACLNDFVS